MNASQMAICDDFVYIPQYGGGTASLNVTVAASIILQSFALWAKLPPAVVDVEEEVVKVSTGPLASTSTERRRASITKTKSSQ